jgi:hypothetical protein
MAGNLFETVLTTTDDWSEFRSLKVEIQKYIDENGGFNEEFYVGISQDEENLEIRYNSHLNEYRNLNAWYPIENPRYKAILAAEDYFVNNDDLEIKTLGGTGGCSEPQFIYVFKTV